VPAVLVMAKAPVPGRVKTRLGFDPAVCAAIQMRLIKRTVEWALAVAPEAAYVALDPLTDGVVPARARVFAQSGGGLGDRLAAAVAAVPERPLLVVGVDTRLTPEHAASALARLDEGNDVVFGPALDGGYYLVGLSGVAPSLFQIAPDAWGGPEVLALSEAAARGAGLSVGLIAEARDLDTREDAEAMVDDPELGPLLRRALGA
jgi:glycosyltransferase A (GT-A) superfamily protein (DUF2064 family)